MKPDTTTAMAQLVAQIRQAIPFETPTEKLCDNQCRGCAKKLLEFLDMELGDWEHRLESGEQPSFGDIDQLARRGSKIHRALQRMQLVKP
ncbi:hypothetical protein ACVBEJ_13750 [Porticoccus sp. GXU_MW_L64]